MNSETFHKLRREYVRNPFNESDAAASPFRQFENWFDEAVDIAIDMPNAMSVSTVNKQGEPESRMVLMKDFDETGFVFFTNYDSSKGKALIENPKAHLLFYWSVFDRQIRISGSVEKVSQQESLDYFSSRPIDSQIAATISPQSQAVENREYLEQLFKDKKISLANEGETERSLSLPNNWGGFRVKPSKFEFWQGRENRLHDRITYLLDNSSWTKQRIAP